MRVLYISLKCEFGSGGDPTKGYSYEFSHIYDAWNILEREDEKLEVIPWWIDCSTRAELEALAKQDWDLVFCLPVNWHNTPPPDILCSLVDKGVPIIQLDCDPMRRFNKGGDPWILDRFQQGLATHFLCPAPHMVPQYEAHNMPVKVMHFGCPSWIDREPDIEKDIDVAFVGQCHGIRQQVVQQLRGAGIRLNVFGRFWPAHIDNQGPVSESDLNRIFNRSKIVVDFTWISQPPYQHQLKGRFSEAIGAGVCYISTYGKEEMEGCSDIAVPGRDFIQVYTIEDMIAQIKLMLENDEARQQFADNAYAQRGKNLWTTRIKKFMEYAPEWLELTTN